MMRCPCLECGRFCVNTVPRQHWVCSINRLLPLAKSSVKLTLTLVQALKCVAKPVWLFCESSELRWLSLDSFVSEMVSCAMVWTTQQLTNGRL